MILFGQRRAVWHLAIPLSCFLTIKCLTILHLLLVLERTQLAVLLLVNGEVCHVLLIGVSLLLLS